MRYKIMAVEETGEVVCWAAGVMEEDVDILLLDFEENHPEVRFYVEEDRSPLEVFFAETVPGWADMY